MNHSIVKNFKVMTALTRAHGHRYEAHALEKLLCGLQGPSMWGLGLGPDRDFLHTRLQALFSAVWTTVSSNDS